MSPDHPSLFSLSLQSTPVGALLVLLLAALYGNAALLLLAALYGKNAALLLLAAPTGQIQIS